MYKIAIVFLWSVFFSLVLQAKEEASLKIYNWPHIVSPNVIEEFSKQEKVKLVYDLFDSDQTLDSKLMAGNTGYDIVVPTLSPFLIKRLKLGVFEPLDKTKLKNYKNLNPAILKIMDQQGEATKYSVPLVWGAVGIGVDIDKVKEIMPDAPVNSLEMIFNPEIVKKFAECGFAMLDSPAEVIPAALIYAGYKADDSSKEALQKAEEVMLAIRPYVKYFHSMKMVGDLSSGDVCLVYNYSGDVMQAEAKAREAGHKREIRFYPPKEGALLWIDALAILKDANNKEEAYKFIDYLLDAKIAAENTNFSQFANANLASDPYIKDSILMDPQVYIPLEVLSNAYIAPVFGYKKEKLINRMWLKILSYK